MTIGLMIVVPEPPTAQKWGVFPNYDRLLTDHAKLRCYEIELVMFLTFKLRCLLRVACMLEVTPCKGPPQSVITKEIRNDTPTVSN